MNILISAFSCSPNRGSEPGIGWNWVKEASRRHEVWLITSDEFKSEVQQAPLEHVHVFFLPSFRRWSQLKRLPLPGLDWLYYYWWQWKAYRAAQKLHTKHQLDLVHHATFGSWRIPSFMCLLPIPLVWGPVGGGETTPERLRQELGWRGSLFEKFRDACQWAAWIDPLVRMTMKRSAAIIASNPDTAAMIPRKYRTKIHSLVPCSGVSISEMEASEKPTQRPSQFIILFAAVLEPRKGGRLAIKAFRELLEVRKDVSLLIIGKGAEEGRLVLLTQQLGISDHVQFLGYLPRTQVLGWMQAADLFLFPSLRDSGGFVLLEAMMSRKPVVCLDLGGPGYFVTEECGIKVRLGRAEQVARDLAAAMEKLAADPALRTRMGEAGYRRVAEIFDWRRKGELMDRIYRDAIQTTRRNP